MPLILDIIVTYIKENTITKLQKLYSLPRNPWVGNKWPMPFVKNPLCTSNLSPAHKVFIERPAILDGASQQKLFIWRKTIPCRWDLFYVEVISHLVGMNQFSYKQYVFTKQNIPFCQDLTQVRHLTWDDFSHINSS